MIRIPPRLVPALDLAKAALRWLGPGMPQDPPPPSSREGGPLARLADGYPLPTWRPLARIVSVFVGLFLLWAMVARLDEVAIATGDVQPEGKVKVIQHLEGGIVRDIYVQDGSEVHEGAPLLQLELPVSSVNREELQVRLDGLMLQRARLKAELSGEPPEFPAEESARQPQLVEAERRSLDARREALAASLSVLREGSNQKQLEVTELVTRQRALEANLRLARERLAMSANLLKSGLTAKMDHVQQEAQTEELEGQLAVVRAQIPRAQAGQAEAFRKIDEEQTKFNRTVRNDLSQAELDIARNTQLLSQATEQQTRTQITSPIDGIVKNLRINTIGGVIKAGDPIMEIVPVNERLQVEAHLSPMDRGYVQVGQRATVKITAYDYTTYGGLDGEVILVAPDTTVGQGQTPEQQQPYYRVVVRTDRAWLGDESAKHTINAGMQASVEIHTGTRTVMEYLVKPVLKLKHEAFRER